VFLFYHQYSELGISRNNGTANVSILLFYNFMNLRVRYMYFNLMV